MIRLLLTLLTLTACSTGNNTPVPHTYDLSSLDPIEQEILNQLPERQDQYGWIDTHKCDALLHSGILPGLVDGVNILTGKDEKTGKGYRTPFKDCNRNYQSQRSSTRKSKSACSRDGYAGFARTISHNALLGKHRSRITPGCGRSGGLIT